MLNLKSFVIQSYMCKKSDICSQKGLVTFDKRFKRKYQPLVLKMKWQQDAIGFSVILLLNHDLLFHKLELNTILVPIVQN